MNLVAGDTNNENDVFVRDRQTGTTSRVSVSSSGVQANALSGGAAISADGRYVAFRSYASNLVAGDTNIDPDVFLRDRQTGTTSRASVSNSGVQANSGSDSAAISPDGRYVAFRSYASNLVAGDTNIDPDVFLRDRQTGTTSRVSVSSSGTQANGGSYGAAISADDRYVAFASEASNLVAGDTNNTYDVFVHELAVSDPPPDGKYAVLTGTNEVPGPGDADGSGVAIIDTVLRDGAATGQVCAQISTSRVGTRTAAHLHTAQAAATGPVVLDLTGPLLTGKPCVTGVSATLIKAVCAHPRAYYVNVHTSQ